MPPCYLTNCSSSRRSNIIFSTVSQGVRRGGFKVRKLKPSITSGSDRVLNLSSPEYHRSLIMEGKSIVDSGEKPYLICVCGRGFALSSGLASHKCSHIEEKPRKCADCGKGFPSPCDTSLHERVLCQMSDNWPSRLCS
ncbi:uncharacterized protein [Scyliorhinus torazame]